MVDLSMAMLVYQRVSPNFSLNSPTWFCCFNRPGIAHLSIPRFGPCRKVMSRTSKPPAKSSLFLFTRCCGNKTWGNAGNRISDIYGIYGIYESCSSWGTPILGNLSLHTPCWSAARPRPQWPGVTISKASDRSRRSRREDPISMAIGGYTYIYMYVM